jgi:hypothetical protein
MMQGTIGGRARPYVTRHSAITSLDGAVCQPTLLSAIHSNLAAGSVAYSWSLQLARAVRGLRRIASAIG